MRQGRRRRRGPRRERLIDRLRVLTLFAVSRQRLQLILQAQPECLQQVHAEIVQRHGTVERYLSEACAVDQATLERRKQRLL